MKMLYAFLALLLLVYQQGYSQQGTPKTYSGMITDSSGIPIPGATVSVKNSSKGVVTKNDGSFSIQAVPGTVVAVSIIGYLSREVTLGNDNRVQITMTSQASNLTDIIVVGYGTQRKASVTGAVSTVKSDDLIRTPATTTSSALVGKMPGITARSADSRPGNGTSIQIRNLGSPLFVIDGIPYTGSTGTTAFGYTTGSGQDIFNNLGLDDIENITILKDASASIYGLRASNGVVLVTTKKGKKNEKPSINMSGYYGFQNFTRYPHPANAGQYVRALVESEQNLGRDPSLLYSPAELAKWEAGTEKGYKSYDYYKEVLRPNVPQYYISANASGGTQRSNYYMSVSRLKQDAVIKDYNFERTNLQANMESSLAKGLKVGTQISARLEKRHNVGVPGLDDYFNPFLSIFSMWPTESPYANDNPKYINQTHNVNVNPATYTDDITGYVDETWRGMNVNLNAQYDFNFGLSIKGIYSYNYLNEEFDGFEYTWDAYKYDPATDSYHTEAGFGNQNPWRERHKRNVTSRYGQFQLSYNHKFGGHNISAVAAYELSDYDNSYYVVHTIPTNNYVPTQYLVEEDYLSDEWNLEARAGYIGRINYDYKSRYLVEVLGRYDGSYLYGKGHRWGFFPGVSLGWRISEEPFFKNNIVNDLKIRASYGETGSELGFRDNSYPGGYRPPDAFGYLSGYNFNQGGAVVNGSYVIGLRPRGLPVTELSWVKNRTLNAGIDFTVLNNKLSGQIDVFERRRTGLPAARYDVLLPSEVGYGLPNANLNADATRGIEGMVAYTASAGKVNYSIAVNATYARLRSLSSYKPRFGNAYDKYRNSIEDRWSNVTWGYQLDGRFQSEDEIKNYKIDNDGQGNRTELPGDFKYKDVNGDGIINDLDQRPIGYAQGAQPYVSFGLNGSVGYKGITLRFDFAGATMQSFLRDYELRYPFQNNGSSPAYMLTDRWHRADPYNPNSNWISGKYPVIRKDNTTHVNYRVNDFWITNVHYIRLKNLELSYNFNKELVKRMGLSALRVYVNGTNLFSLDNVKQFEIDPEISAVNGLVYPQQRLYNFGFNVSF
ncbi:TonB-linked outer membrane protein, SusC/RagA family [Chitinophaga sp. YR573]|uniref:SusC/RagA family TonB-linked outer membrane protein n=1 Tax=Chitinophaga sp. YR573 TaxID=1881040 RepID=UPI0008D5E68A|nr:TonB-dependent receptor [Chitinophaga sp. YR573]SEW43415.1 TonB-linked outer membrane protein, SusC/RagA family [Chitinophaga sp. YR573]